MCLHACSTAAEDYFINVYTLYYVIGYLYIIIFIMCVWAQTLRILNGNTAVCAQ